MTKQPKTIQELMEFYYGRFKPLYSMLQQTNEPPLEMLFEINAAFDHLSRIWKYGEDEEKTVRTACAHLKRGSFDACKLTMSETRRQYDELRKTGPSTLSLIDNGKFVRDMHARWAEINALGLAARMSEGDSRTEELWHVAFDKWEIVLDKCADFTTCFYLNENVNWAKDKATENERKEWRKGLVIGILASLAAAALIKIWSMITKFYPN